MSGVAPLLSDAQMDISTRRRFVALYFNHGVASRSLLLSRVLLFGLALVLPHPLFGAGVFERPHQPGNSSAVTQSIDTFSLDVQAGAIAAYSLRKLRSEYAGAAVRVRRSGDDEERDIGFDLAGNLDRLSLLSFAGSSDAYVAVWYDQSGNGSHARAPSTSGQGKLVSAGALITDDRGQSAIQFDGNDDTYLVDLTSALSTHNFTVFWGAQLSTLDNRSAVFSLAAKDAALYLEMNEADHYWQVFIGDGNTNQQESTGGLDPSELLGRKLRVLSSDSQNLRVWSNDISTMNSAINKAAAKNARFNIGSREGSSRHYTGFIQEVLLYPNLSDTDRAAMAASINSFYNYFPATKNNDALLPQDHQYQVDLYDWMETLKASDFDVAASPLSWSGDGSDYHGDIDELYRIWIALHDASNLPSTVLVRVPSKHFVLDDGSGGGIEGSGTVQLIRLTTATYDNPIAGAAAWWTSLDIPGNSYYDSRAVKLRAAVAAAVEMMTLDKLHTRTLSLNKSSYLGGNMADWAFTYWQTKDVLSVDAREAFEAGLDRMRSKMETWGPHDGEGNMDSRSIPALVYLYLGTDDSELKNRSLDTARRLLFGSKNGTPSTSDSGPGAGIFHQTGYIGETDGPETTYNGISLFYLTQAAIASYGIPEWNFLWGTDGVVDRMARFKVHQYFREPQDNTGVKYYDGPSGYAKRTGNSYVFDQRPPYWRDMAAAMLSDHAKSLILDTRHRGYGNEIGIYSESDMNARISSEIGKLNEKYAAGVPISDASAYLTGELGGWWPEILPYTYNHYVTGSYNEFERLVTGGSPLLLPPMERSVDLNESFNDEFWLYKSSDGRQDFGFFIESVQNSGTGWGNSSKGGLQAFWAESTGMLVLTRHDKWDHSDSDWPALDTWTAAHVWGMDDSSTPKGFSNGPVREKTVDYNLNASLPNVRVLSTFKEDTGNELQGSVNVEEIYTAISDGVKIDITVGSDRSDRITELWASIPVFLRDARYQSGLSDTSIEFWDGSSWLSMNTSLVSTTTIRLGRDFGQGIQYGYINFPSERRVKLSAAPWQASYQAHTRMRTIHIDLHGTPGTAANFPSTSSVSYSITTSEPSGISGGGSDDSVGTVQERIRLNQGWNTVSISLSPSEPALEKVFASVLSKIILVKDQRGETYHPDVNINSIGNWNPLEAYQVYASEACELMVEGTDIDPEATPVSLAAGWNLLSYLVDSTMPVEDALASILQDVVLIKDNLGRIYHPESNVNSIGSMTPGDGYAIYVHAPVILTYPAGD